MVNGRLVKLEGSPLHPVNLGALCPKGQAATELLYNPDRVQGPLRRTGKRPTRLLAHPRFRAAYDFLLLRNRAGENLQELCDWWTAAQKDAPPDTLEDGAEDEPDETAAETAPARPRRRRRRRAGRGGKAK